MCWEMKIVMYPYWEERRSVLRVGIIRELNPNQIELAVIPQANNDEKTVATILGPELCLN